MLDAPHPRRVICLVVLRPKWLEHEQLGSQAGRDAEVGRNQWYWCHQDRLAAAGPLRWAQPRPAWQDDHMAESWTTAPASAVHAGDRIRLATGLEMVVSRIEPRFLGRDGLTAFIEDTPARWYKQPLPETAEVQVADPEVQ